MRNIAFIISILCSLVICAGFVVQDKSQHVEAAFVDKDAQAISAYFPKHVQLTVLNRNGVFSQVQARRILTEFFDKHPHAVYRPEHTGCHAKDKHYSLGYYSDGKHSYRVTYHLYKREGDFAIRNLSIIEK